MMLRAQQLCRALKPVLGDKIDRLWSAYLAEAEGRGKADIEQTLELLAAKHLGLGYEPDRTPFRRRRSYSRFQETSRWAPCPTRTELSSPSSSAAGASKSTSSLPDAAARARPT
jgi:hypothetical protein